MDSMLPRSSPGLAVVDQCGTNDTIAVVITTYNDSEFLAAAIRSVLAQDRPPDEVIVVDDGSDQSPEERLAEFPQAIFLRQPNRGLSSARNAGLRASHSRYISFLDADDLYMPRAFSAGLACFKQNPDAAMVYGGHRRVDVAGRPIGVDHVRPPGEDVYADLLTLNFIGMHAAVLYRRDILQELGGFDESLRTCEDYDLYLRLAATHSLASHAEIVAEYRRHARNMSSNLPKMLEAVLKVHDRHRLQEIGLRRKAWHTGQRNFKECYRPEPVLYERLSGGLMSQFLQRVARSVVRRTKSRFRGGRLHRLVARTRGSWPPLFGTIRFGDLGTPRPASRDFAYDRGNPIDRYYIENFLVAQSADVRGHVLEVAENTYSQRFGGSKITKQDVIHLNMVDAPVTIVGDLTQPGVMPDETFDCIIITQTLQMIFNLEDAVTRLHAALKPGGVLLLTVPGITQLERGEWGQAWCWSFTQTSVRKLFEPKFSPESVEINTYGNCFAAIAYLFGAALEEVDHKKLDVLDLTYPMIVTLRAQKR